MRDRPAGRGGVSEGAGEIPRKSSERPEVLTVKGRLQRHGDVGKSLSIIMERVVLPWSGLLSDLLLKKRD